MVAKSRIVDVLGERSLLLPQLLREALAANDRAKYWFSLLQAGVAHALEPEAPTADLRGERRAALIEDGSFDAMPGETSRRADGRIDFPGFATVLSRLIDDVDAMLAPLRAATGGVPGLDQDVSGWQARFEALAAATAVETDVVERALVSTLTSGDRQGPDSLHLLVMDLHKALNRLQIAIAEETVAGAAVYGLEAADRPLVAAFMRGLNRTARLKFDHPGLGTTATRAGDRLVIQNDLGTTDAHVLVLHVQARTAIITYTDVHPKRLAFFQGLFDRRRMAWQETRSRREAGLREHELFHLAVGTYAAADDADLEDYLDFAGSRLVFLIDWNKARRRLERFVGKDDAVSLLKWAADNEYGHRAFLELGGERLIYGTVEQAARAQVHYGESLADILGPSGAIEFLRFVLRAASEGRLNGRSQSLIRDQIRAELIERFSTVEQRLIDSLAEHAGHTFELAMLACEGIQALGDTGRDQRRRRAERWEREADRLVVDIRAVVKRNAEAAAFAELVGHADDIADALEEAVFFVGLLPAALAPPMVDALAGTAALLRAGVQDWIKGLDAARDIRHGTTRQNTEDFLLAIDGIVEMEHRADAAQRQAVAVFVGAAADFRQLHLCTRVAESLEQAADAAQRAAQMLRDHVLDDVLTA